MTLKSARAFWIFLAAYTLVLLIFLPHLSLWMDEILGLSVSVQPDLASFLQKLKLLEGGTPLTFVPPAWAMALLGKTAFAGRLPSAIASVAACPAIFLLARRLGIRQPLAAVAVFALFPLQFRYAMEARPYAIALCFSIWSTVAFLRLLDKPRSVARLALYALLLLLGAYTMLFALFTAAAHLLWLLATANGRRTDRRVFPACSSAVVLICASLIPWFLMFREDWKLISPPSDPLTWRVILLVSHELTGAGYFGTALILAGVVWGIRRLEWPSEGRAFYVLYALVPALLAPLTDLAFSYFFAIRQLIFVIAPLALLFALGTEALGRVGKALLVVFLAAALYEDVTWMIKPRENWQAAAAAASAAVTNGACVIFVPANGSRMFEYFDPRLLQRQCAPDQRSSVILAVSPYESDAVYATVQEELKTRGYVKDSDASFDGPRVEFFHLSPSGVPLDTGR